MQSFSAKQSVCPGTQSVDLAGIDPTEIHLSLLPACWD